MFDTLLKNTRNNKKIGLPLTAVVFFSLYSFAIAQPLTSIAPSTQTDSAEDEDPASARAHLVSPQKLLNERTLQEASSLLDKIIVHEANRLSVPADDFADHIASFTGMVKYIESTGNGDATNAFSGAMSYYQFLPNSVITAVNRMEIFMNREELGRLPSWARQLRADPQSIYDVSLENQTILMLVNIFEQSGSEQYLTQLGNGNLEAAKDTYYIYHHTAPDSKTIEVTERTFARYFK